MILKELLESMSNKWLMKEKKLLNYK